ALDAAKVEVNQSQAVVLIGPGRHDRLAVGIAGTERRDEDLDVLVGHSLDRELARRPAPDRWGDRQAVRADRDVAGGFFWGRAGGWSWGGAGAGYRPARAGGCGARLEGRGPGRGWPGGSTAWVGRGHGSGQWPGHAG